MKRIRVLVGATAIIALFIAVLLFLSWISHASTVSYAATSAVTPSTTSQLVSGVSVQNLGSVTATVVIEFYDQAGTRVDAATQSRPIGPNTQGTWFTSNISGLTSPFIGSAVVSSDQPVAANVNTQTTDPSGSSADNPVRVGTSSGVITPTTKVYAPQVMRDYYGYNSAIYAQNTLGTSATVTATIIGTDGLVKATVPVAVPGYAMKDFKLSDMTGLGSGFVGSAVIDSPNPLAVVVNFWAAGTSDATAQFFSYNGFGAGATKLYVPRLVRNYYDYNGGFKVQNIGTSATTVTVSYYIGSSNGVTQTAVIQPNQAWGPYMGADGQLPAGLSSGSGAAIIESSGQPIVATVNDENRLLGRGATYNAIVDGSQTDTLALPQVTSRYYGYSSGIQFQNVGAITTSGTISLTMGSRTLTHPFTNVGPNRSFSLFAPNVADPSAGDGKPWNLNGGGLIHTDNGQPIVGIGNLSFRDDQDTRYGQKYGDSFTTYNALNR